MKIKSFLPVALALTSAATLNASRVLDIPMTVTGQNVLSTDGKSFTVSDQKGAMEIAGADGRAWRTDGHTSYITGNVGNLLDSQSMTAQVAFAIDTNAIIGHDDENADKNGWAKFVDCTNGNNGFSFSLGRRGQFKFSVYVGGQLVEIASNVTSADGKLQLWQWNELSGVVNGNNVKLYLNGTLVGEKTASGTGVKVNGEIMLGRDKNINDLYCGVFRVGDFNGAIDYLRIDNSALTPAAYTAKYADLNLPSNRYAGDKFRAKYHGQPGMNWTNETHGFLYNEKDGKYHVIFQRTGSIPGMSHAHYGHIISDDLFNWSDDKPMIWPSEEYDKRGCWSGCIFKDSKINGGKPAIIYTGVEYGSTSHANIAFCDDDVNLRSWHKTNLGNPLDTYNNVARDTYFFRVDDSHAYFIIGDEGHMKSYKYNESNGSWSANGHFYDFLAGETGFTEMPNVAKLPNGKWLMTFTPWTGSVKCIYRIGDIDSNGKFVNPTNSELFDFYANDGFCTMSPTIGKDKDGNLVALGIVADKMATEWNMDQGYAHLYSLPRTLGVDAQGRLTQKPFNGYEKMFGSVKYTLAAPVALNGSMSVNPVRGRQAEVCATFTVADASFGINFLQNAKGKGGKLTYNPSNHTLSLDVANIVGDGYGMKGASYTLPVYPAKGEDFKIQMFIDHSIVDLFVNDRYASSFRIFPESMEYDLIEVFSNGTTTLKSLTAHLLGDGDMRDRPIEPYVFVLPENSGKVAFLKDASSPSAQEQAACDFFTGKLKNNNVILTSQASKIDISDYDCLWIHIDRTGLAKGANNLPENFRNTTLVDAISQFVREGGNLYVTGQATQLLQLIGRIPSAYAPNEFNSGDGNDGADEWTVNPKLADKYNHSDHAIYKNLEESDAYGWTTYGLLFGDGGAIRREDHNCMWNLTNLKFQSSASDRIKKFEEDTHSSVIGTWGQDRSDGFAGIIEFYPLSNGDGTDGGTIIANGLAACQWYVANGSNADAQNLQLLTANTFAYLAAKDGSSPENPGGGEVVKPEEPRTEESLESTGRVAMFVGYSNAEELNANAEEKKAYDWFVGTFGADHVLFAADVAKISANDYDCVWIHVCREGIAQGSNNLPDIFKGSLIQTLKTYVAAGGNLFLTKHATQIAAAMGRVEEVNIFNSTVVQPKDDNWDMNIQHYENDWTSHPIFASMNLSDTDFGCKVVRLMSGSHNRTDYNCMWDINGRKESFCSQYNCEVLGTWGHNGGQTGAGMLLFYPQSITATQLRKTDPRDIEDRKGTIITNGLAAYQWNVTNGTNASHSNIEALTNNVLYYLSPVVDKDVATTAAFPYADNDNDAIYFNLQGMRVVQPVQGGIYIVVKAGKSQKVIF